MTGEEPIDPRECEYNDGFCIKNEEFCTKNHELCSADAGNAQRKVFEVPWYVRNSL